MMVTGLFGRKVGMTQVFNEAGVTVPVTVIQVEPNYVTQVGRRSGTVTKPCSSDSARLNVCQRPAAGHLKGLPKLRHLREVDVDRRRA